MNGVHRLFIDEKENEVFNNEVRKGFLKLILLNIIREKPTHGYEIIQKIQEKSGGRWTPSPGSVYPALEFLESKGYIVSQESERKKVYSMTPKGEEVIEHLRKKREEMLNELKAFLGDI